MLKMVTMMALAFLLAVPATVLADDWAEPDKVAEVESGRRTEAVVSWWGFDPEDSTRFLQAAFDSPAGKVWVPNLGEPWISKPLTINRDDLELVFEPGTLILAKQGEFLNPHLDSLFTVRDRENITFNGYGATFRMRKHDYTRPPYRRGEWRHTISLRGSTNVKILGLTLEESGGDGIYIGSGQRNYCRDIEIRDVVCDRHHRQGISVISVENLLIENTVLKNTAGTAPMAGIDFEPNRAEERLVNVVMRNVTTENNAIGGFFFWFSNLDESSIPFSIRLENCTSTNDYAGIYLRRMGGEQAPRGTIDFVNVQVEKAQAAALLIEDKCAENSVVRFIDCTFGGSRSAAPLRFSGGEGWGGLEFQNVILEDWADRPFASLGGELQAARVRGHLLVRNPYAASETVVNREVLEALATAGLEVDFETATIERPPIVEPGEFGALLDHLKPASGDLPDTAYETMQIRYSHAYALYAEAGEQVELEVEFRRSGRRSELEILSPAGDEIAYMILSGQGSRKVEFTAEQEGIYRLAIAGPPYGGNSVRIRTRNRLSLLPHLFNLRDGGLDPLLETTGSLYFQVPDKLEPLYIRVRGSRSEPEGFKVVDQNGQVRAEHEKVTSAGGHTFRLEPEAGDRSEIWSIQKTGGGTFRITFYPPIVPVVANHPAGLLVQP